MTKKDFPLTLYDVRKIANDFAEQLNTKHRFNKEAKIREYDWLQ